MGNIIAMAGLAEAQFLNELLLVAAVLALAVGFLRLGRLKRWSVATAVDWALCLIDGLLFQPWHAFRGPEFPNDPDEVYWLIRCGSRREFGGVFFAGPRFAACSC